MSELDFKSKEFVYNHHLSVPFRPLVMDAKKGIGSAICVANWSCTSWVGPLRLSGNARPRKPRLWRSG